MAVLSGFANKITCLRDRAPFFQLLPETPT
jgi:hypothetical protein